MAPAACAAQGPRATAAGERATCLQPCSWLGATAFPCPQLRPLRSRLQSRCCSTSVSCFVTDPACVCVAAFWLESQLHMNRESVFRHPWESHRGETWSTFLLQGKRSLRPSPNTRSAHARAKLGNNQSRSCSSAPFISVLELPSVSGFGGKSFHPRRGALGWG